MKNVTPSDAANAVRETEAREQHALDALRFAVAKQEFVQRLNMLGAAATLTAGSPARLDPNLPAAELRAEWQRDATFLQALVAGLITHATALLSVVESQMKELRRND